MFLLNTIAVNGVISWPAVERIIEAKNCLRSQEQVQVNLFGKDQKISYWHKVQTPEESKTINAKQYVGTIKVPGIVQSKLNLQPPSKESRSVTSLSWTGEDGNLFGNGVRKWVILDNNGAIKTLIKEGDKLKDIANVHIEKTGPNSREILIDDRKPNGVELYSINEALFLTNLYMQVLEQIKVAEEKESALSLSMF